MRVSRVMKYVRDHKYVYDIFQVFVLVFTLLHFGACAWVLLLNPCDPTINDTDPVDIDICNQDQLPTVYIEAFHMSTVMILGISNSHIVSKSSSMDILVNRKSESDRALLYIISTIYMVCGLFILALLMSETNAYLMGKMQGSAVFQRRSDRVKHEMEYYGVPHDLQMQVKAFYDYVWIHQKQYDDKIALLSDGQMSTDLQRKLALHLFKDVVSHISFFSDIGDILLGEICLSLRTRIFLPDHMILFKGDVGKELFIISKGVVEVLRDDLPPGERKSAAPILLKNGSFFGEIALVMEVRRTCSVQARTICEVNILQQRAFDAILQENPDFARRMNELVVARQLETTLSRSVHSGVDFQVSREDIDKAVIAVESNMREGLRRRRLNDGIPTYADLPDKISVKQSRLCPEKNTNRRVSAESSIQWETDTQAKPVTEVEISDGEVSRRSHKVNVTDIPTMIGDIARRSMRFKGDDDEFRKALHFNQSSEGRIIQQEDSSGNLDICSDGEVVTTTRKINKRWWKKYRRKDTGRRSSSIMSIDRSFSPKKPRSSINFKGKKSLQMKSLDARLDVQDEMMKKLITKLENFEKNNPCDNRQDTNEKLVKESQLEKNSAPYDAPKPPPR